MPLRFFFEKLTKFEKEKYIFDNFYKITVIALANSTVTLMMIFNPKQFSDTEINKEMTGKYLTGPEMAAQDEQILDLYLANESKFITLFNFDQRHMALTTFIKSALIKRKDILQS